VVVVSCCMLYVLLFCIRSVLEKVYLCRLAFVVDDAINVVFLVFIIDMVPIKCSHLKGSIQVIPSCLKTKSLTVHHIRPS
jgi:hypothetical protein